MGYIIIAGYCLSGTKACVWCVGVPPLWPYPAVHPLHLLSLVDPPLLLNLPPLPQQPRPERHLVFLALLLLFFTPSLFCLIEDRENEAEGGKRERGKLCFSGRGIR